MKKNPKNKHDDNFLLFLSTPTISKKIEEIRKFIEIPKEIFNNTSDEEIDRLYEQWIMHMAEKAEEISDSISFQNELKEIRSNLESGKIKQREAKELSEKLNLKIPINYLSHSIKEMIGQYNLPSFYDYPLRTYITSGVIKFMGTESFGIRPNFLNDKFSHTVDIVVHSELTDQDLIEIKKRVNIFVGKHIPRKIKPIKEIKKKLKTEEYYNDRSYVSPVDPDENYKSSAKDIVENIKADLNKRTTVKEIYETPRQLKKLRQKRFGIN